MAMTPKAVRRNGGDCTCSPPPQREQETARPCRYGRCTELRCTGCNGKLGGIGVAGCPCDGGPRQALHRGMDQPGHWDFGRDEWVPSRAAVKPSIARRRNRRPARASW